MPTKVKHLNTLVRPKLSKECTDFIETYYKTIPCVVRKELECETEMHIGDFGDTLLMIQEEMLRDGKLIDEGDEHEFKVVGDISNEIAFLEGEMFIIGYNQMAMFTERRRKLSNIEGWAVDNQI
jgi:hypothetical protein